jgi:glycosyltransferase involved in cell wall biosynthesis
VLVTGEPKVSVIIPAYNAEKFIEEAIRSILNQDLADFELLVIDDFSSDSTPEIVQRMATTDSRIKLIRNYQNLGVGKTRAVGVEIARGSFIAWMDADDVSEPHRLSSQIAVLESNLEIGVVGGYIQFFKEGSLGKTRRYATEDGVLRSMIFRQNPIAFPAATFRASVHETIGNFSNLRQCEDLDILLRVGARFKFANVPEVLVRYRQVESSITRSSIRAMESLAISLRLSYRSHSAYRFGVLDWFFLAGQSMTLWMPSRFRIWIFSIIRGDRS